MAENVLIEQDPKQAARVFIYTLADPETGDIRYVGKAIDLRKRFGTHLKSKKGTHKDNWVQSLRNRGLSPVMEILEEMVAPNESDWQEAERYWIESLRVLGCRLTNSAVGGLGGGGTKHWKFDSISKMSKASKDFFSDPKNRELQSARLKGKSRNPEHHKNWLASEKCLANTKRISNIVQQPEIKKKASQGLKAKWNDPVWRAKMLPILRANGGNASPEARAKMSAAGKGRKRSPETTAKILASKIGYHHSELTKLKIRLRALNRKYKSKTQLQLI